MEIPLLFLVNKSATHIYKKKSSIEHDQFLDILHHFGIDKINKGTVVNRSLNS